MRTTKLFAVAAAALILAGIGGWASSTVTKAGVPTSVQIDPFQMMVNSTNLPASHYDDYSLVFI
jgi:hypothetical protein